MHGRTSLRRFATLVLAATLGLGIVSALPASAAPPDPSADQQTVFSGYVSNGHVIPKGDVVPNDATYVYCIATFNPAPLYGTGGRYGAVHWGGKINCTGAPGVLEIYMELYTIVGSGDNERRVPEVNGTATGTGYVLATKQGVFPWTFPCLGNTRTRWIANLYAQYDAAFFNPYPAWSSVYALPCN